MSTAKTKYIKILEDNFKKNEDFKIYDYDEINEEILRFKDKLTNVHNRTIHLIISPRCFKKLDNGQGLLLIF
jgi:hypothetical protein